MTSSTFRQQRAARLAAQQAPATLLDDAQPEIELVVDPPAVPERLRNIAYFALLVVSLLVGLTAGLAPIWLDEGTATRVVASVVVVSSALGTFAGGLGVVYRPYRPDR